MGFLDDLRDRFSGSGEEESGEYTRFRLESISPGLKVIPDSESIEETDIRYPLIEPFADAHISWDGEENVLVYRVEEPSLAAEEKELLVELKDALEEKIDVPLGELNTNEKVIDYLEGKVEEVLKELGLDLEEGKRNKIMYYIYRNFAGFGKIEALMHDPYIEDIGCSGVDIPIFVVHGKFGSVKTDIRFEDEDELKNLVVKLAERSNKYVSYAEPLLDGTLPDGSRVNASLTSDVTTRGPTFSIRKFQEVPYSAVELLELGTANLDIMAYMWLALEYKKSILVIGGTATGKTTFLNSIVTFIPPEEKIVSIEDTRELHLPHENWIPSVTRTGLGLNTGETDISMYKLLRESFRQNPDYVVVGEVRGEEASVLFQGMASGHPSLSTMHASSPMDVVSRLTTPPIGLSPSLVETLDIIVVMTHAQELDKNARRVKSVYEIEDISREGNPRTNEYSAWTSIDDSFSIKGDSTVMSEIRQQFGLTEEEMKREFENRKRVLEWLMENNKDEFSRVARTVSEYYTSREDLMGRIGGEVSGAGASREPGEMSDEEAGEVFGEVEENPFE